MYSVATTNVRVLAKPYLRARDFATVLATDHESNMTGITPETDPSVLFTGNNSCILTPEVTQGPYYVTGEFVRKNVTEDQEGVPLTLDIQVIDVNTCDPLPAVYLEQWHCNATGVYGGIIANGNGNTADASNINATFLRGIQKSDTDGVLTFETIVPGHYTGRTPHIHVLAHLNASLLENATISGGTIGHVGQLFFDQDLITQVEATAPYNTNTQNLTLNSEDSIMEQESSDVDPVVEYVMLGDSLSDGIFAWIAFGMDSTASYNVSAAASYGVGGGVANNNTGMGGGGFPSGGMPSGTAIPSGAAPSGA